MEPKLIWFELMVCPFTFRLAVVQGHSLLFGYKEEGSDKRHTTMMRYQGNEQRIASILESLHWLVQINDILSLPPNRPRDVFRPRAMNSPPSLHLRISHSDESRWASVYSLDGVPPKVQALLEQCQYLGHHEVEGADSEGMTHTEEA